jgi:amino acid permease
MYQTNIPMIYSELKKQSTKSMWKVLIYGTSGATFAYILAGIFGFTTFALYPITEGGETCDEIMSQ